MAKGLQVKVEDTDAVGTATARKGVTGSAEPTKAVKVVKFVPHEGKEATKNCFRFSEVPEGGQPPMIGELYVQRWALGGEQPKQLTVTFQIG